MAYNLNLANRVREAILELSKAIHFGCTIEEKQMMGGLTFMVKVLFFRVNL